MCKQFLHVYRDSDRQKDVKGMLKTVMGHRQTRVRAEKEKLTRARERVGINPGKTLKRNN